MAEDTIHRTTTEDPADYRTEIKEMFAEMNRLNAEMKQDQEEIDRIGKEIRVTMAETKVILDRLAA